MANCNPTAVTKSQNFCKKKGQKYSIKKLLRPTTSQLLLQKAKTHEQKAKNIELNKLLGPNVSQLLLQKSQNSCKKKGQQYSIK